MKSRNRHPLNDFLQHLAGERRLSALTRAHYQRDLERLNAFRRELIECVEAVCR